MQNILKKLSAIILLLLSFVMLYSCIGFSESIIKDKPYKLIKNDYSRIEKDVSFIIAQFKELYTYYTDIPVEYRDYLLYLSLTEGIPLKIVSRVPKYESNWDNDCEYHNWNGSIDRGIIQINSQYESWYLKMWWKKDYAFDVWNPYHNLYLGFQEIKWCYSILKDWEKSVMAYNCGIGNVRINNIPDITIRYVNRIFS